MGYYFSLIFLTIQFLTGLHVVVGHGYVHSVDVGGQTYPGWNPFSDPYVNGPPKIVRMVLNDGFVARNDPDLACHHGGNEGTSAVASAPAGSKITFQWTYWPGDHQGPVSTYMTSCSGNCSKFSANNARWFKIDAEGYDPSSRQWAAAKLISNGASWTSTIPTGLSPGEYLIRNEIIALHSITPQFYPSCAQVKVTGSGTHQPSDRDLVSMQALYAGASFPNIYGDSVSFSIPGPPPVNFDGNGGATSVSGTTVLNSSTRTQTLTAATPVSTGPTQQCSLGSKKLRRTRYGATTQ